MFRQVISAGILGGIALLLWTLVVNGLFGFQARIDMKALPAERQIYEILKENVREPGRYVCNPEGNPESGFPKNEPVFSILYGGMGHEAAGRHMLIGLFVAFVSTILGAWLLSQASARILASFSRKVLFFAALGTLMASFSDIPRFGIGGYPFSDTLVFAAYHIATWILVGGVVAWRIRPRRVPSGTMSSDRARATVEELDDA